MMEVSKISISGVLKVRVGVTEFMLRLMAWLCTSENHFRNCQMCIVTGPNIVNISSIYTEEEIDRAKHSPSFDREYRCQFSGFIGNLFSPLQVDKVIELGEQYSLDKIPTNDYTLHSVGVDFGFSSSATAIVLTEFLKEERKIRYCTQKNLNMLTLRTLLTSALTCIESTGTPGFLSMVRTPERSI